MPRGQRAEESVRNSQAGTKVRGGGGEEVLHGGAEVPLETRMEQALLTGAAAWGEPTLGQGSSVRRKEQQKGAVVDRPRLPLPVPCTVLGQGEVEALFPVKEGVKLSPGKVS